jgi:nitroreductase
VDARLAIASKRDVRDYADRPVPADARRRILDAGRVTGSGRNRQPWRFLILDDRRVRERVAASTTSPGNLRRADFVVAIAIRGPGLAPFDAGRAAQNMMLAAWDEGIVSCPTGLLDREAAAAALPRAEDERLLVLVCFGYPARPRDPERRSADEWTRRAPRRPLDEVSRVV